jgi:hypothetical protein
MGQSQFLRRRLGVRAGDSGVAVGVAGIGRRHPDAGDAFDIGRVADPVSTDAEFHHTLVHLPGQIALQAADAVLLREALGRPPGDIGANRS